MANSANYTATKEDSRSWRSGHDTLANSIDEASVATAAALQAATRATTLVEGISVSPATVTLDISDEETQQLTTTTDPADLVVQLTYASSDPTKATVDEDGLITPLVAGETTVTVTEVASGETDTCVVTVVA